MAKVSISILNADFGHMQDYVDSVSSADAIQYDVMDGHFVPNLSMGPAMVSSLKTDLFQEAHLMVTNPSRFVKAFCEAGCKRIIFHVEVEEDIDSVIKLIRAEGAEVGLALSMKTPVEKLLPHLSKIDMCIIMPITPGFGGQAFDPAVVDKIRTVREVFDKEIQVDGGVNLETGKHCVEAGADNLLVGSFLVKQDDRPGTIEKLRLL